MVEVLTHVFFQDHLGEISSTKTTPTPGSPARVFSPHSPTNPPPAQSSQGPTASDGGGISVRQLLLHQHLQEPLANNTPSAAELDELARRQIEHDLELPRLPPLEESLAGIIDSIYPISPALSEQMRSGQSINPTIPRFSAPPPVMPGLPAYNILPNVEMYDSSSSSKHPETPPTPQATDDGMGGLPWHRPHQQQIRTDSPSESETPPPSDHADQSSLYDGSSENADGGDLTGSDLEIVEQYTGIPDRIDPEQTFVDILLNPTAQGTTRIPSVLRYLQNSFLSDNQLVSWKEQSPTNPRFFFNLGGLTMTHEAGIALMNKAWICDNADFSIGKLVMLRDNFKSPGSRNRVVVVDPQYTAKLAMERGNTRNIALVNMMAKHKTSNTQQYHFPTNADKVHWFLIVANLNKNRITGFETIATDRMGALIKVRDILNDNWDVLGSGPVPVWKLKMKMPPLAMPLQKDSVNCGIYTCAFMDLIAAGVTYSKLRNFVFNRNINHIREQFARFMNGFNHD
jgi:hypothetical protein